MYFLFVSHSFSRNHRGIPLPLDTGIKRRPLTLIRALNKVLASNKHPMNKTSLIPLAALLAMTAHASGAVIYSNDFNYSVQAPVPATFLNASTTASGAVLSNQVNGIQANGAGGGAGNNNAYLQWSATTNGYSGNIRTQTVSGNFSSSILSDYTFSVDVAGLNLASTTTPVRLELRQRNAGDTSDVFRTTMDFNLTSGGTYSTLTASLNSFTPNFGTFATGTQNFRLLVSIVQGTGFGSGSWTNNGATINTLRVDNLSLSVVPEPSSLALVFMAITAFLLFGKQGNRGSVRKRLQPRRKLNAAGRPYWPLISRGSQGMK